MDMLPQWPGWAVGVVVAVSGLLGGVLSWWAWRRPQQRARAWRLVASWVAVAGLTWLVLQPHGPTVSSDGVVVLLTAGTQARDLQSLSTDAIRYHLASDSLPPTLTRDAMPIGSAEALRLLHPGVCVQVMGWGIPADLPVNNPFSPHSRAPGWLAPVRQAVAGQRVVIRGRLASGAGATVTLLGPGPVRLARQTLGADGAFALPTRAGAAGPHRWHLVVQPQGASPDTTSIWFWAQPQRSLRIAIVHQTPDFEQRFLRDWALAQGHQVMLQTGISRDRTLTVAGVAGPALDRPWRKQQLDAWDLLVTDAELLANLAGSERSALIAAVANGLGVLVRADVRPTAIIPKSLHWVEMPTVSDTVQLQDSWGEPLGRVGRSPYRFRSKTGEVLAQTAQDPLVLRVPVGAGTWGVSLVRGTHLWQLQGETTTYGHAWADWLQALARPAAQLRVDWQPAWPIIHRPMWLWAASPVHSLHVITPQGDTLRPPLLQDTLVPFRYQAMFWPRQAGWHRVLRQPAAPSQEVIHIFVAASPAAVHPWHLTDRTQVYQPAGTIRARKSNQEPLPLWWGWLAFLLGASFLWIERHWP